MTCGLQFNQNIKIMKNTQVIMHTALGDVFLKDTDKDFDWVDYERQLRRSDSDDLNTRIEAQKLVRVYHANFEVDLTFDVLRWKEGVEIDFSLAVMCDIKSILENNKNEDDKHQIPLSGLQLKRIVISGGEPMIRLEWTFNGRILHGNTFRLSERDFNSGSPVRYYGVDCGWYGKGLGFTPCW